MATRPPLSPIDQAQPPPLWPRTEDLLGGLPGPGGPDWLPAPATIQRRNHEPVEPSLVEPSDYIAV